jgi:regulatory associated protein of mTOR
LKHLALLGVQRKSRIAESSFLYFAGNNLIKFRTPPVSPPQHDFLPGLRRVCSMEFGQHPISSPDGLAVPLLSSAAATSNAELSILPQSTIYNWSCGHFSRPLLIGSDDNEEANARREERERLALDYIAKCQRSCMWTYISLHYILLVGFLDYLSVIFWLFTLGIAACKMTNQIASWDTRFELGTKTALLLPFSPIVVAADENEQIR